PGLVAGDPQLRGFAEQLAVDPEVLALARGQGIDKTEPGVVPGPCMFRAGIAQPDDEADAVHRIGAGRRLPEEAPARSALLVLASVLLAGVHLAVSLALGFRLDLDARVAGHGDGGVVVAVQLGRQFDALRQ